MQKILRRLTATALLVLLICLLVTTALAVSVSPKSYLKSSWGEHSYFDDDDRIPWGSSRLGSSWGDRSYFDDDDRIPWGSSRLGHGQVSNSLGGTNTIENTRIDRVGEVQMWLNKNYSAKLYVDGIYGKLTKKAIITALQIELGFTGKDADGIADAKMLSALPTMRTGTNDEFVKLLQCLLVCNGYRDAFVDGSYGNGTCLAVQSYQAESDLSIDGICGKDTWTALLT